MAVYEPKQKNNKVIVILIFIMLICFGIGTYIYTSSNQEVDDLFTYALGDYTHSETKELLEIEYANTYTVSDYLFYGECLNIFKEDYNLESIDSIVGKSLILKDVTSDKEYSFVLGSGVDSQIVLTYLQTGVYEVFIIENLVEKRVVYDTTVEDSIKTVSNAQGNRLVTLKADQEYFSDNDIDMDENYLFLIVEETTLDDDEYDIVIDPGANDYDFTWTVNLGSEGNGLYEYLETYTAAILLKEKLEEQGLKVLITREQEEELNSYGEEGRLAKAYASNAKYYIKLTFSESELNYSGLDITYSAHASTAFASQILYELSKNNDISLCSVYSLNTDGLISPTVIEGMDGRTVYDLNLTIRESGGKATGASYYSENASSGTGSFAKDNTHGMYTLVIDLGYLSNDSDASYWINNKEEYMQALSDAILSYVSFSNE